MRHWYQLCCDSSRNDSGSKSSCYWEIKSWLYIMHGERQEYYENPNKAGKLDP
jgi:hypothetical protein